MQYQEVIMKIAIIEDDEITRLELSKLLKKQGYGTVLLTNFKNLTEELSQYVVDLVLLDINLPYENGYEICKKMKKVQQVPVIFVTSRDSSADELKSIQVGGIDFITKPYDTVILLEKIKRALKLSDPNNFREIVKKECTLDLHLSILKYREESVELTRNEFRILYYFFMSEEEIISEILPKPRELQNKAYYYALKKACKSMNEEISKRMEEQLEYQEYVESFAHEIKIPIGALSLIFDNTKNYVLKKETDKIFQLVEQMLYYARSENTEKDYFVKKLNLEDVIHNVILKFRHSLLEVKTVIDIHDMDNIVYTDEKWLSFVLSQIIQNSIKYFDKEKNCLSIYSQRNDNYILLVIEDNGCGIKQSELARVLEKGFTGSNRKKANATGMGLYLSKKLCDRLGLKLEIDSKEEEYTKITIIFPKGSVHSLAE